MRLLKFSLLYFEFYFITETFLYPEGPEAPMID